MTDASQRNGLRDEHLVAYLDGELPAPERDAISHRLAVDPRLLDRLNHLKKGERSFRAAFEPLLADAPEDALRAKLEAQLRRVRDPDKASRLARLPLRGGAVAAALLIGLGVGLFVGTRADLTPRRESGPVLSHSEAFRQAVAEYQALYSYATLANQPNDRDTHDVQLARISRAIGIALPLEAVSVTPLVFKRAQILQFQGMRLAQLAYLSGRKPVAFCIVRNRASDRAPAVERRKGLAIVHWAQGGRGFMVIGDMPEEDLQRIAADLRTRLG